MLQGTKNFVRLVGCHLTGLIGYAHSEARSHDGAPRGRAGICGTWNENVADRMWMGCWMGMVDEGFYFTSCASEWRVWQAERCWSRNEMAIEVFLSGEMSRVPSTACMSLVRVASWLE